MNSCPLPLPLIERPLVARRDVPDALFPTEHLYDITMLDLSLQAEYVHLPVVAWGSVKRNQRMEGTYHFYVDDYRFSALLSDPTPVLNSQCRAAVEPNFTTSEQCGKWHALSQIGLKRWLARYWQSQGLPVWVDLNVAPCWYDLNLLGVPQGWRSYMTRGYVDRLEWTLIEYQMAAERAGTQDIRFAVYGGGKAVHQLCAECGWVYVPECMDSRKGRDIGEIR